MLKFKLAVVSISGGQYIVTPNNYYDFNKLKNFKVGDIFQINSELAVTNENDIFLSNVKVEFEVLEYFKGDKIIIGKKKPKKNYRIKKGFRPHLTKVKVRKIYT